MLNVVLQLHVLLRVRVCIRCGHGDGFISVSLKDRVEFDHTNKLFVHRYPSKYDWNRWTIETGIAMAEFGLTNQREFFGYVARVERVDALGARKSAWKEDQEQEIE